MTIWGMPIAWEKSGNVRKNAKLAEPVSSSFEAGWNAEGNALCIGTPRLTTLKRGGHPFPLEDLSDWLQPKGCESRHHGKCKTKEWTEKLRTECGVPQACPLASAGKVVLKSEVDAAGEKLMVRRVQ